MQVHTENYDDEEAPLSEGEYEEGLDDDYDDEEEYDEEEDLEGQEDEDEGDEPSEGYITGLGPLPGGAERGAAGKAGSAPQQWQGLETLPAATRTSFVQLLNKFRAQNKQELTILVLGKHFVGKTFTVNSLLNESAGQRTFLNRDLAPPAVFSREAHGFKLTIIDPAGLTDADFVSTKRLGEIAAVIKGRPVDVFLYLDRLDTYRVGGPDVQIIKAISENLGPGIWSNAVVGLTHASETVNGYAWEEFATRRAEAVQQVIRKHSGNSTAELPVAFIENASSCEENDDGEKILPDGRAWLPDLMEKVTGVATSREAYKLDVEAVQKAADPNRKYRWLVPLVFAAQIALKALVFDRLIKDDYITGDKHGPYEASVVKAERVRMALENEGRAARSRRKPASRVVAFEDTDSD